MKQKTSVQHLILDFVLLYGFSNVRLYVHVESTLMIFSIYNFGLFRWAQHFCEVFFYKFYPHDALNQQKTIKFPLGLVKKIITIFNPNHRLHLYSAQLAYPWQFSAIDVHQKYISMEMFQIMWGARQLTLRLYTDVLYIVIQTLQNKPKKKCV